MVTEDGQHSMYVERNDYPKDRCSEFVRRHVVPNLGRDLSRICTQQELGQRLRTWFSTMPRRVQLASDSTIDRDLLLTAMDGAMPANVAPMLYDLRPLIDTAVYNTAVIRYHEHPDRPWHHALHDAQAHRAGWLAWMDIHRTKKV